MFELTLRDKKYLLVATLFLVVGCGEASSNSPTQTLGENTHIEEITVSQQELLDAINNARSVARDCYPDDPSRGFMDVTHPITWNSELYASALEHATGLAESNTFSHDGSGTSSDITGDGKPSKFYERIIANGYSRYYTVGENIAGGQQDLEQVMKEWIKSPAHCTNIMKDSYKEIGVAIVTKEDSKYGIYWVQNFGAKTK